MLLPTTSVIARADWPTIISPAAESLLGKGGFVMLGCVAFTLVFVGQLALARRPRDGQGGGSPPPQ